MKRKLAVAVLSLALGSTIPLTATYTSPIWYTPG